MTTIEQTAFARLDQEGRLLNPVLKQATHKDGRFGFRGILALKFAPKMADELKPPEIAAEQVIATAVDGQKGFEFLTGYLLSFGYLQNLVDVLGDDLTPAGKYILYCDNLDLSAKYQVKLGGAIFHCLPIDEATVYNEVLELLSLEKGDLKKLDTAGKTDAVADAALGFSESFEEISFEEGLKRMGPVRNRNANRPV